jgi:hypothetical protein
MKTEPTNQYMFLVRGPCKQGYSPEQMQAHMIEVYAWIDSLTKQGIFSAAQPLTPEGFFILNVQTMDEAVKIACDSPMVKRGGQLEVRHIAELKRE